jgi:hypothetical protein
MATLSKTQPLEERITAIRAEIDKNIDKRVAEIAKECPGVPAGVIRNSITRGMGCQCAAYLQLQAKEEAEEAAA